MSKAVQKLYGPLAVQQQQITLTSALFSSKTWRVFGVLGRILNQTLPTVGSLCRVAFVASKWPPATAAVRGVQSVPYIRKEPFMHRHRS